MSAAVGQSDAANSQQTHRCSWRPTGQRDFCESCWLLTKAQRPRVSLTLLYIRSFISHLTAARFHTLALILVCISLFPSSYSYWLYNKQQQRMNTWIHTSTNWSLSVSMCNTQYLLKTSIHLTIKHSLFVATSQTYFYIYFIYLIRVILLLFFGIYLIPLCPRCCCNKVNFPALGLLKLILCPG